MLWQNCLERLRSELSEQKLNTWLRPLQSIEETDRLRLLAPNRFVLNWVQQHYIERIQEITRELHGTSDIAVQLEIGTQTVRTAEPSNPEGTSPERSEEPRLEGPLAHNQPVVHNLNPEYTFANFVEGKSNQLAKAATLQVTENPGHTYNPLFLYGDVGLGKTHLIHAAGNQIRSRNPQARVAYLHSERFIGDMVKALKDGAINQFKSYYRNLDALLIDDVQFLAGKDRSQEEFFYTFNALLEGYSQIVLTSDRYPREVKGLEERLKSRFGWGLTVGIESPELETRVAILQSKAERMGLTLEDEIYFLIAKNIHSNVRDLEGALHRVQANAEMTGRRITADFVKEALKDIIKIGERLISVEAIQRTVAEYYGIRVNDLLSTRRARSVARPRQMAMAFAKELTGLSLPEIGRRFAGRDHTTVLHACRKVDELRRSDPQIEEDYKLLLRKLTG